MAKFKVVPQSFLVRKMTEYWYNMVQNLHENVHDRDFFDLVEANLAHDRAVDFIKIAFTDEEIKSMGNRRERSMRLDLDDSTDEMLTCLWNYTDYRKKTRLVMEAIYKELQVYFPKGANPEGVEQRLKELQQVLKLNDLEREILTFAYLKNNTCLEYPRRTDVAERPMYFAMALDRSYGEVLAAMGPKGRLRKFNILDDDWDFNGRAYGSFMCGTEQDALERRFYKKCEEAVLPWSFYGSLAETHGKVLKDLLAANVKTGGKLNILLYGAPGTGKTSYAKSLAAEMGRSVYEVLQGDSNGRNISAESRMAGIQLCNEQVEGSESLMIVDEADELLRSSGGMFAMMFGIGGGKSTEKGVLNTILDDMKVPTIWISNTPAGMMDESVRRRFDYSICFEKLNTTQREAIWTNSIQKLGLERLIPSEKIPELAMKYVTSAGGISIVLENVKRLDPKPEDVEKTIAVLMKSHCELMETEDKGKFLPSKDYSLKGLNIKSKIPLEKIEKAVSRYVETVHNADPSDRPRMSILLHGVPGSGKTEWVRHLGQVLGKRVIVKMGADILGKYVGENEKNIRAAFREAEAENAILFFDEVDSLLQSRENAHASWEVSQVNQLLHDLEESRVVVVCATNFLKSLDPAVLRRFSFKVEFRALDDEGKKLFFERIFKSELTPEEKADLSRIPNLCPGDFRAVKESLRFLGEDVTNEELLAGLREESEVKPKSLDDTTPIGF